MLHQSYKMFGLILTFPFLIASSETANLSEINIEIKPSPTPEPVLLQKEPKSIQPETQNRREGREYCQGIGVC